MKKICIVGLGYVGLPLAVEFSKFFDVVGYDIDSERVAQLQMGVDRTREVTKSDLIESDSNGLVFTDNSREIKTSNIYIVTVPTPIDEHNKPNLTPLISASSTIGSVLKVGDLVIYESTVYPGVTEEICVPVLAKQSGLTYQEEFFCGYSPERINPGDRTNSLPNIVKVTAGSTPSTAEVVDQLYRKIIKAGTYKAPSIRVAEAAKVIENTQRDVNIALINELAIIFEKMGLKTKDVIDAAATKWNFNRLYPGLVGGHCIGVDPYYLTHKSTLLGYVPNLILSARQVNNEMAKFVAEKTVKMMIKADFKVKDSKVLILGFSFKENCSDIRNTRVIDIKRQLESYGCRIDVSDYLVDPDEVAEEYGFKPIKNFKKDEYSAIVVAVGHDRYKELHLTRPGNIVFDVKSILSESHATL